MQKNIAQIRVHKRRSILIALKSYKKRFTIPHQTFNFNGTEMIWNVGDSVAIFKCNFSIAHQDLRALCVKRHLLLVFTYWQVTARYELQVS